MEHHTVLITGASSGIGRATARALLSRQYTVYAAARRVDQMEDLEKLGAIPLRMDLTSDDDIIAAADRIGQDHGGVDILINNAGFGLYGAVEDIPIGEARYQAEVNLFGLARLTQLVLPFMREKRDGRIINISSMLGRVYIPLGAWYVATKHALEGWSDCLRLELQPFGIHVIIVEPGLIQTRFGDVALKSLQERSGKADYRVLTRNIEKMIGNSYREGARSSPSVVADVILKAIRADRPAARYPVGRYARPLIFARKWLGDRLFDRLILSQVKGKR